VNQGRDDEALAVLSKARGISADADLVRLEFLCVWGFYLSRVTQLDGILPEKYGLSTYSRKRCQSRDSPTTKMVLGPQVSGSDFMDTSVLFARGVSVDTFNF